MPLPRLRIRPLPLLNSFHSTPRRLPPPPTIRSNRRFTTHHLSPPSILHTIPHTRPRILLSPHHTRPLSSSTKAWLHTESIFACKLVAFGSLALLISGSLLFLGLHGYLELQSPTPSVYSLRTRAALHTAYHARAWEGNLPHAAGFLDEAVTRIEAGEGGAPLGTREGRRGLLGCLVELGGLEGELGLFRRAAGRWRRVLELAELWGPGEVERGVRVTAAMRLGGLLDEVGGLLEDDEVERRGKEGNDVGVEGAGAGTGTGLVGESDEAIHLRKQRSEQEAERLFTLAYTLAAEDAGIPSTTTPTPTPPGVLPPTVPPHHLTPTLLTAAAELGIHHARFKHLSQALPIFLSLLRARTSVDPRSLKPADTERGGIADPCEIGKVQAYIGEVLWAAGEREQGVEWERRAVETVTGVGNGRGGSSSLVEERAGCRDCAVLAAGNWVVMVRRMLEEMERGEEKGGEKGRGWSLGLWRGKSGEGGRRREEWEGELGVAEECLKGVLGVRVSRGK